MKALIISTIILIQFSTSVLSKRDCIVKKIENSDTVCVCNTTYCDDFPPLQRSGADFVSVYESNKFGDRFKQTTFKLKTNYDNKIETKKLNENEITITLNKDTKYQRIYGFGGAFTDSTGFMLRSVDQSLSTAIIESYFSDNGIEYSFGRVPIAGTDFSTRAYTYDDVYNDKNLAHFALQREDFEYKIPFIKLAQKLTSNKLKLIAANWCPPLWMKQTEDYIPFSELKGEVGGEYYQILAKYLIKFLNAYKENGINFWGLSTQNEPVEDHQLNSLKFTPESLEVFIKTNLGPMLEESGYGKEKLKLLVLDDNLPFLKNWTDIILNDSQIKKYVSGVAVHWYYNQMIDSKVESILDFINNKYPDYFVLNTEACILDGPGNGQWDYAERYAYDIIKHLNHWGVGWVEWNMALDLNAGPTWFERLGCGAPVYIDPLKGEAYKQPTFYALGHFSKFVSPDSLRISHQLNSSVENVYVFTAKRPDNAVVVIVLNRNDIESEVKLIIDDKMISNKIPGHSIQSYILWN